MGQSSILTECHHPALLRHFQRREALDTALHAGTHLAVSPLTLPPKLALILAETGRSKPLGFERLCSQRSLLAPRSVRALPATRPLSGCMFGLSSLFFKGTGAIA